MTDQANENKTFSGAKFLVEYDEKVVKEAEKRINKRFWAVVFTVAIVCIGLGIFNMKWEPVSKTDKAMGIVLIGIGVIWAPLVWLITEGKNFIKGGEDLDKKRKEAIVFTPDFVTITTYLDGELQGAQTFPYKIIYKIEEVKDCYFIYPIKNDAHILPKYTNTEGDAKNLSAFLQEKLGNRFLTDGKKDGNE